MPRSNILKSEETPLEYTTRFQIIVPAFNEEESIEHVLRHAMNRGYLQHMLIVDDASTDSTPQIIERWAKDFGLRAVRLHHNCKKEGAIRAGMEALLQTGALKPYTVLLDSDSMLIGDLSGSSIISQIEQCIDQMDLAGHKALALRIDAALSIRPTIFEACALADYTAMQVDQWLVGLQGKLWVINGPGGIFETRCLLPILQDMEPDFETGDLLITVKLMMQGHPIGFCSRFCVETFVPSNLRSYFKQRRRWERGTTKVLWNEMIFYLGLFPRLQILALATVVHLLIYLGMIAALGLMILGRIHWTNFFSILMISAALWFVLSVVKGAVIKLNRPSFKFLRYCGCAVMNSALWVLVTTPARLAGFADGVRQILSGESLPFRRNHELLQPVWLDTTSNSVKPPFAVEERES